MMLIFVSLFAMHFVTSLVVDLLVVILGMSLYVLGTTLNYYD